jgi:hypothetical protein
VGSCIERRNPGEYYEDDRGAKTAEEVVRVAVALPLNRGLAPWETANEVQWGLAVERESVIPYGQNIQMR